MDTLTREERSKLVREIVSKHMKEIDSELAEINASLGDFRRYDFRKCEFSWCEINLDQEELNDKK